jgi:hypothetical protein
MPLENLGHDLRVHHRESGAGLDRHVHAAVLAEFVAHVRERSDRIEFHGVSPLEENDICVDGIQIE